MRSSISRPCRPRRRQEGEPDSLDAMELSGKLDEPRDRERVKRHQPAPGDQLVEPVRSLRKGHIPSFAIRTATGSANHQYG